MTTGYSGTPLAKKLSLSDGLRVWRKAMPPSVAAEIEGSGLALRLLGRREAPIEAAHVFETLRAQLEAELARLRPCSCRPA